MARVFVTGGTGVLGTALIGALLARGDEVAGLARSDASAEALCARGVDVVRGDTWDVDAMTAGMRGCDVGFHLAGVNALCVADPAPMRRANVDGAVAAVHAAAAAGLPRLVHTSSAATIGEPAGTIGSEWTKPRGWYLSSYEQTKTEGEDAVLRAARESGQDVVCVNPSSVQGPGRAGGTGRLLLLFLDGRLKVFVDTNISLVDIDDCIAGHLLAAQRGAAGERYLLSGIRLTITEALSLAAEVAGVDAKPRLAPRAVATVGGACVEAAFKLRGKQPPVCREMVRTLLHGHRYDGSRAQRELGLEYTPATETLRKTIEWARSEGLLGNA
jgi:dihydroflavonol-4-reductase